MSRESLEARAARMRLKSSEARLRRILDLPVSTPEERAARDAEIRKFWQGLEADMQLTEGSR